MTITLLVDLEHSRQQLIGRQRLDREADRVRTGIETVIAHGARAAHAATREQFGRRAVIELSHSLLEMAGWTLPDMGILAAIRKGEILRFSGSQ
jgi:hypothetical protein